MWEALSTQPGLTTTVLDFTNDLWLLGIGLGRLIWLSVGLLVFTVVQDYPSQATKPIAEKAPAPVDYWENYQEAA